MNEEYTWAGDDDEGGWILEISFDTEQEALDFAASKPWVHEKGGELHRRTLTDWEKVTPMTTDESTLEHRDASVFSDVADPGLNALKAALATDYIALTNTGRTERTEEAEAAQRMRTHTLKSGFLQIVEAVRQKHVFHMEAGTGTGIRWTCSCGKTSAYAWSDRTEAQTRASLNRHLQAAFRDVMKEER